MARSDRTKTEIAVIVLRWSFNIMVTAAIAVLFGLLGWMISLFLVGLVGNEQVAAIIGTGVPWVFGIIGAMLGARTLLTHI